LITASAKPPGCFAIFFAVRPALHIGSHLAAIFNVNYTPEVVEPNQATIMLSGSQSRMAGDPPTTFAEGALHHQLSGTRKKPPDSHGFSASREA